MRYLIVCGAAVYLWVSFTACRCTGVECVCVLHVCLQVRVRAPRLRGDGSHLVTTGITPPEPKRDTLALRLTSPFTLHPVRSLSILHLHHSS
jgi:hypothetical protein